MPPERSTVEAWLHVETERLLRTVDTFRDRDLSENSSLPGWSVGHLLTHIARNADALCNLLSWARTGVEAPMYQSAQQREDDIKLGAVRPAEIIVTDVLDSAERLQSAATQLSAVDWANEVVTAQGRSIPAGHVPWLRLREVALHHVDLGAPIQELPAELVRALLDNVVASTRGKADWPALRIEVADSDTAAVEFGTTARVTGAPDQLLAWLIGRSAGSELTSPPAGLPALPAWL
ncbi:maleylpyruvate isomerase family mycothiol-dependent enzyme [Mycolicibacterium setense]|uniref:maleylpyruvate isomerase family mycothiol-dependent enzyme n=1 Tax=Mycolicibacterium setense TaxID=431269 RepID=UPI000574D90F|nr:maleylpyruvate isomerase family mycothiol-dependent enzyme [Mycolicibacterium setense]KHO21657.1 hypothetical protein QQ25_14000 [Mycolicibacterium setense]MCV7114225.1 maleylpyruvate isomerase family mycothiol-dependent enzyme [Mycolicibacterium setense]